VLNRDDSTGAAWAAERGDAVVYGIDGAVPQGRYLIAREVRLGAEGIAFMLDSSWGRAAVRSRLLGRFNVYNLLAALAALLLKGLPLAEVASIAAMLDTVPGRIEGFRGRQSGPLVVVDYAHTPEALTQILSAVRAHCAGRLWCVFGCGGDRDRGKRPLMGAAAAMYADVVIVTDDNPRSEAPEAIAAEITHAMPAGTRVIHDRAEAIRTALAEAASNDVVVVAGKGHETTQTYGSTVRPFSDRARVRELLA
jgi:UDP-N-acetylmuramoyl-L-alanyl-D-glutamate--2,6-diaminopimelate ligase